MKIYMYSYFNTEANFHGPIMCFQIAPEELSKNFVQLLVSMKDDALKTMLSDDLYYLGVFDNVSGEITSERTFLLHVSDCASVLLSKRVKADEVEKNV